MKEIKELTPEQESKIPEYVEKWQKIGHCTDKFTQERAESIIHQLQTKVLGQEPTPVIVCENPREAYNLACAYLEAEGKEVSLDEKFNDRPGFVTPYLDGSYSASIFSFYDFFINETDVEIPQDLLVKYLVWQSTAELGFIYPLDNVCVVSQKPKTIKTNEQGFHCDGGPALEFYGDVPPLYSLNGVTVDEYLACTPAGQLSLEYYKTIQNADVKMEFVRKFGVERMLELGKPIDTFKNYNEEWWTKSQYELVDMAIIYPNIPYAPHLKMLNQTTGVWHVEAVSPQCHTIEDALKERFGGEYEIAKIA
jgi:hypothetical protein